MAHWTLVQRALAAAVECFRSAKELLADGTLILVPVQHTSRSDVGDEDRIWALIHRNRDRYDSVWQQLCAQAAAEISAIYDRYGATAALSPTRLSDVAWSDDGLHPSEAALARSGPPVGAGGLFAHQTALTLTAIRTLHAANVAAALALPTSVYQEATHRAILSLLLNPQAMPGPSPQTVVTALASAELPLLADLPTSTLLRVRRDESAFVAWRAELRNATRLIRETPCEPGFSLAARDAVRDMLLPRVRELDRLSTVRQRAAAGARDATIAFGIGGIGAIVGGGAGIESGLAAAGAASAAGLTARALLPDRRPGANAVVMRLLPFLK